MDIIFLSAVYRNLQHFILLSNNIHKNLSTIYLTMLVCYRISSKNGSVAYISTLETVFHSIGKKICLQCGPPAGI
jgi:hypothetical protein